MTTVYVQEDGGGDYTTLAAAVAANQTDIEIQGIWSSAETANITIDDANTSIVATGAAKVTIARHIAGSPNHYRIEDNSGGHVFTISAGGIHIEGIEIHQTGSGSSDECVRHNTSGAVTLKKCILWGDRGAADQDGIYFNATGGTLTLENCILYNFRRAGVFNYSTSIDITYYFNCVTIYDCGESGETYGGAFRDRSAGATSYAFNSIFIGSLGGVYDWSSKIEAQSYVEYCRIGSFSEDEPDSTTGTEGGKNATDDCSKSSDGDWIIFNDITGSEPVNLSLCSNDHNEAQHEHSVSSGPGSLTMPSDDIDGNTRTSPYSIGACEIAAAGTTLQADSGSYSLIGSSATLKKDSKISAEAGALSLSGQVAGLFYNRKISAEAGAYSLAGTAASFLFNRKLQAESASYLLSGSTAGLLHNKAISALAATFNLTGTQAALLYNRLIAANAGSYALTGSDAQLLKSGFFVLTADSGVYSLTGKSAELIYNAIAEAVTEQKHAYAKKRKLHRKRYKEEEEIFEIIKQIVTSGKLD